MSKYQVTTTILFWLGWILFNSWAVMWLWNWVVPEVFHASQINMTQSFILIILARLLNPSMVKGTDGDSTIIDIVKISEDKHNTLPEFDGD